MKHERGVLNVTGREIVKAVMSDRKCTQQRLAEAAGYKRQTNVSEMLRSDNMRVDNLVRLLEAMECEVIVRSKRAAVCEDDQSRTFFPEWKVTVADPTPAPENK